MSVGSLSLPVDVVAGVKADVMTRVRTFGSLSIEESEERCLCCGVHVSGVEGDASEYEHVLVVGDAGGLQQEPHEELVGHVREPLLFGFLVDSLELGDVGLHRHLFVLAQLHELANVFAHIREVVFGELLIHEVKESLPSSSWIAGDSGDMTNIVSSFTWYFGDLGIRIKIDGEDLVSDT